MAMRLSQCVLLEHIFRFMPTLSRILVDCEYKTFLRCKERPQFLRQAFLLGPRAILCAAAFFYGTSKWENGGVPEFGILSLSPPLWLPG